MAIALQLANDFQVWDGTEAVTYGSKRVAGSNTLDRIDNAKRRSLTFKEVAASNGAYTGQDMVWLAPAVQFVAINPKPGDIITDGEGIDFTILQAELQVLKTIWKFTTRNLVLAFDLRDIINIETGTTESGIFAQDATGAKRKQWRVRHESIKAKVQPVSKDVEDERGIRGMDITHNVWIEKQLDIDVAEDRIVWNGKYLDLVRLINPEVLSELPMLEAKLKP